LRTAEYNILDQLKLKGGVRGTQADRTVDECGIEYFGDPPSIRMESSKTFVAGDRGRFLG